MVAVPLTLRARVPPPHSRASTARRCRRPRPPPPAALARKPRPGGARTGAVAMERELVPAQASVDAARAPRCSERPQFHLAPPHGGWVNDPNAPIVDTEGRLHLVSVGRGV